MVKPIFIGAGSNSPERFLPIDMLHRSTHAFRLTTVIEEVELFWYDLYNLDDPLLLWKLLSRCPMNAVRFPIVTPWQSKSLGNQGREDPALRLETSFLIRILQHYGLCVPIAGFEAGEAALSAAAKTRNSLRIARLLQRWTPVDPAAALESLSNDLNELRSIAGTIFKSLKSGGPRSRRANQYLFNEFVNATDAIGPDGRNMCFLYSMSLFDRLGKWSSNRRKQDIIGSRPESPDDPRTGSSVDAKFEQCLRSYYGIKKDEYLNSNATGRETLDPTYRVIRDCARIVRHGVLPWIRNGKGDGEDEQAGSRHGPIKILLIDDELLPGLSRQHDDYASSLKSLVSLLARNAGNGRGDGVEVHVLNRAQGIFPSGETPFGQSVDHLDSFISEQLPHHINLEISPTAGVIDKKSPNQYKIEEYDVIFVDVNFSDPYGGPQVVYALSSYLERRNAKSRRTPTSRGPRSHMPSLIVLTNNNRFDQAYECLNLGAHGFLTKDRILQSLVRLRQAIEEQQRLATVERTLTNHAAETFGHRTSFRMLHGLSMEHKAALKKTAHNPGHLIVGDELDYEWIRSIPKTDLHVHLGSSISLPVIQALAWNSVGRMITAAEADCEPPGSRAADSHSADRERSRHGSDVILDALTAVFGGSALMSFPRFDTSDYSQAFLTAAQWMVGDGSTGSPKVEIKDVTTLKPLEDMLKLLNWKDNAISEHFLSALFVICLMIYTEKNKHFGSSAPLDDQNRKDFAKHVESLALRQWRGLRNLGDWHARLYQADLGKTRSDVRDWRLETLNETLNLFLRLGRSTHYTLSHSDPHDPDLWRTINDDIDKRIKIAVSKIIDHMPFAEQKVSDKIDLILANPPPGLGKAPGLTDKSRRYSAISSKLPSLDQLMENKVEPEGRRRGLIRYLDKCSLLGSDHLQFPENLLLAAHDLVRQNVQDTVVYSEVRCETPGYTKAGMSAVGATDLLQLGFDSAAALFHSTGGHADSKPANGQVLVRVNVLLAAKRHKKREDCARVISLLERYLEKELRTATDFRKAQVPDWWGSSHVVGFDLSGDESVEKKDIQDEVQRLFRYNAPITIHAGEAASAESVWGAVYTYHARRIGHGLRLQENQKLMQYCVDEGICMELCPSSNISTHGFLAADTLEAYKAEGNKAYPLRNYMEAGLEVCINTDNRSLHRPIWPEIHPADDPDDALFSPCPNLSVTDEYIRAAQLCGGLTRWEVLKLIRAGFRHSFLHRDEIARLLGAVESRLFAEVGQEPGTGWLPRDSHQVDLTGDAITPPALAPLENDAIL